MGYYSDYTITTDMDEDEVCDALEKMYGDAITPGESFHSKWYDHEDHLRLASQQFPLALITLSAIGEDGAQWRVYARNGQTQRVEPVITWAPCTLSAPAHEDRIVNVTVAGVDVPVEVTVLTGASDAEAYEQARKLIRSLLL